MCDWAYHHESLRKQRILERKNEAQQRMNLDQAHGGYADIPVQDTMCQDSRKATVPPPPYGGAATEHLQTYRNQPVRQVQWNDVQGELKKQAKTLRNHNLVMGPAEAFEEVYRQEYPNAR